MLPEVTVTGMLCEVTTKLPACATRLSGVTTTLPGFATMLL